MSALPADWQAAATALNEGGVAVVPTDTLYGLVGSARRPATVDRIYRLRQRDQDKPLIVLIGNVADLYSFIGPQGQRTQELFNGVWPGPVSLIFACSKPELAYLHRNKPGISFRLPAKPELQALLRQTGPLVAPSANPQGQEPARTLAEAKAYFGDEVDAYVDGGRLEGAPSALVDLTSGQPRVLRPAPGFRTS
jgi:L-threonylcarbamoyladenylate synthase